MSNIQPDEALYSLLCKYLLNEADALERQWVEAWRMEQPVNEAVLNAIRQVLEASAPAAAGYPDISTDTSWERLKAGLAAGGDGIEAAKNDDERRGMAKTGGGPRMGAVTGGMEGAATAPQAAAPAKNNVVPLRRTIPWLKAAAVLIVALGAAWWLWPRQAATEQVFAGGEQAVLEDGSKISLQPDAALHLTAGFGKKERRVRFSGKAVFNVAKNADAPFVIEMDQTEIKVLGTEFSVEYMKNAGLTVHVSSGSILVTDRQQGDSVVLTAGMLLHREEKDTAFSVAENIPDLNSKQLVFRNVPLQKVLTAVEAVYRVEVTVADTALLQQQITANFENESIENVIATIAFMTNTQAEQTGQRQFSIK